MPYVARSYLDDPADLQVWRYMDIEKLLSILLDQALFFASTRTIASDDWFEGQFTADELAALGLDPTVFKEIEEKYNATLLLQLFFNCWHMNNTESDAMWKIYVNGNGGVAIASTVARLKESFRNSPEDISLGKLRMLLALMAITWITRCGDICARNRPQSRARGALGIFRPE